MSTPRGTSAGGTQKGEGNPDEAEKRDEDDDSAQSDESDEDDEQGDADDQDAGDDDDDDQQEDDDDDREDDEPEEEDMKAAVARLRANRAVVAARVAARRAANPLPPLGRPAAQPAKASTPPSKVKVSNINGSTAKPEPTPRDVAARIAANYEQHAAKPALARRKSRRP